MTQIKLSIRPEGHMSTHGNQNPLNQDFKNVVEENLKLWHVPGVSVGVVDGDNTWTEGYGIASFPSTPVTPSTLFYAGSTTKAFTAAIMSLLVDDNKKYPQVQWDTPIGQLIRDDFVLEDEYVTNHVTIEDALSHRTGLPRHDQAYGGTYDGHKATVKDVVRSMRYLPLTAEIRTHFQYCNLMFVVVSHVIETLMGEWLGDLMARRIWKPLGMTGTFFSTEDAIRAKEDLARGYYFEDGSYHHVPWMALDGVTGAGSVISNVVDYCKWARALINRIEGLPLSKSGFEEIWRARIALPEEEPFTGPRGYALGWFCGVYRGQRYFEHTGGMDAFGAELIIFPDLKFSVVALANTAGTSNYLEKALAFHLIDNKLSVPVTQRFDWNQTNLARVAEEQDKVTKARSRLFPSLPSPVHSPTVSLMEYTGSYWHPGYQTVTIYLDESTHRLRADREDVSWPEHFTFEHVSGDYFLVTSQHHGDFGALYPTMYKAAFRIGEDGKPSELGLDWETEMKGEMIWLARK